MGVKTELTADDIAAWLRQMHLLFEENGERLSMLDAALGDGDHGSSMVRAFRAVVAKLESAPPDGAGLLQMTGMTLLSVTGGATGPLFGSIFLEAAKAARGKAALTVADVAAMWSAATASVMARGGAKPGDKTMVDALVPATERLQEAAAVGMSLPEAVYQAAAAAAEGAQRTGALLATKGRARYLGERSLGHEDAGAHSVALILAALAHSIAP